jgi:hypothetical protein
MKTTVINEPLSLKENGKRSFNETSELAKNELISKGLLDEDRKDSVGMIFVPPQLDLNKIYHLKYRYTNKKGTYDINGTGKEIAIAYWTMSHLVMDINNNPHMTEDAIFYGIRDLASIVIDLLSLKALNPKKFNKRDLSSYLPNIVELLYPSTDLQKSLQRQCQLSRIFCCIVSQEEFKKNNCVTLTDHVMTNHFVSSFKDNWFEQPIAIRNGYKSFAEFAQATKHGYVTYDHSNITTH